MRMYSILRLLIALFLLYFAWPLIPEATTEISRMFWISWLCFLSIVIGANFATLLNLSEPPIMEKEVHLEERKQMTDGS